MAANRRGLDHPERFLFDMDPEMAKRFRRIVRTEGLSLAVVLEQLVIRHIDEMEGVENTGSPALKMYFQQKRDRDT